MNLVMPDLESYLVSRAGQKIKNLPVLSAQNVPGILKSVDWRNFERDGSFDFEASWVKIEWDNGEISFTTIDFLSNIKVR